MAEQQPNQSFPLTQRELVGLALRNGAGGAPSAAPHTQRDRVRLALALGVGGSVKGSRAARRGIYR
jgi:hypothetical protein